MGWEEEEGYQQRDNYWAWFEGWWGRPTQNFLTSETNDGQQKTAAIVLRMPGWQPVWTSAHTQAFNLPGTINLSAETSVGTCTPWPTFSTSCLMPQEIALTTIPYSGALNTWEKASRLVLLDQCRNGR